MDLSGNLWVTGETFAALREADLGGFLFYCNPVLSG
jgi:hypothetical protein